MPLFAEVIPACAGVILKCISIVRTNVYHRVRKISPAAYGVLFALHMHALFFFDAGVSLSLAQLFAYICLSGIAALVVCFGGAFVARVPELRMFLKRAHV